MRVREGVGRRQCSYMIITYWYQCVKVKLTCKTPRGVSRDPDMQFMQFMHLLSWEIPDSIRCYASTFFILLLSRQLSGAESMKRKLPPWSFMATAGDSSILRGAPVQRTVLTSWPLYCPGVSQTSSCYFPKPQRHIPKHVSQCPLKHLS